MTASVLVWGAGGHGRVVTDLARVSGQTVIGFIDRDRARLGSIAEAGGARITMTEVDLEALLAARTPLPGNAGSVLLGIGDNASRIRCVGLLGEHLLPPALIHPRATVSNFATLGEASVVLAGAVINTGARIGRAVIINTGAIVEHDCVIGDGVHVSPNATLTGGVVVDEGAWVGAGAIVLPGTRIGRRSIIGAGAVVIRDVADEVTVVGNPARDIALR